jgi:hypothetical protein
VTDSADHVLQLEARHLPVRRQRRAPARERVLPPVDRRGAPADLLGLVDGECDRDVAVRGADGTTQTIELMTPAIASTGEDESSFATGAITAIYVPFGPDGGSTLPEDVTTQLTPISVEP